MRIQDIPLMIINSIPLAYTKDGKNFVVVASKGGAPANTGVSFKTQLNSPHIAAKICYH